MRHMKRRISQCQLRSLDLLPLLVLTMLLSLLAGCRATPATIVNTPSDGCPSGRSPAGSASFTPNVIVSQSSQVAGTVQPITLAVGQRLEIRLQPMFSWELTTSSASNALAILNRQGEYDANLNWCVWRFTAVGAGQAKLNFDGELVCPLLKLCPSIEQSAAYRVTVQ